MVNLTADVVNVRWLKLSVSDKFNHSYNSEIEKC